MNAYEISIWRGIKHNDKFIVNDSRSVVVHARNEAEAKSKVTLEPHKSNIVDKLRIDVSPEFIYSVTKIGTVKIEKFYTYSNGNTPVLVSKFKRVKK